MKILISACLLGVGCRYDGCGREYPDLERLAEKHQLIPVCPELLGGLPTPREPAERLGDRVVSCSGIDVTDKYSRGAKETLRLAELLGCTAAVLKERSPSCGRGEVYDGTFSRTLTSRSGVTAELLEENGIRVLTAAEAVRQLL